MLKPLKRKFVLIVSVLVGIVLASVLGMSLWSSHLTQERFVEDALDRSLNGSMNSLPVLGRDDGSGDLASGMPVVALELSPTGIVIATNSPNTTIDSSVLNEVMGQALSAEKGSGSLEGTDIVWKSRLLSSGNFRVALADTSANKKAFRLQATRTTILVLLAYAVIVLASRFLADWALGPVGVAFEKQRQFVADASHELKTPLAVILANSEILLRSPDVPREDMRWIQSTADEARHMKNLVGDLLELAKTDEGSLDPGSFAMSKTDIDLSDLLESAALEFDALAFERSCTIETQIQPQVHLEGDEEWIGRLAKILIENACKYAREGSTITVSLALEAGRKAKRTQARLAVHNDGDPIDPEDLAHIFDRFYRSDKSRTRTDKPGGFGLGLAIAKGIAEGHGGTVGATSDAQDGTTFWALLPARPVRG